MDNCSQVIIHSKTVVLKNNTHYPTRSSDSLYPIYDNPNTIILNNEILLNGYDITGIHMDFPDNLKHIVISFADQSIIFDKDMQEYMKTFPIYLTLCSYLYINISFIYDDDWFNSNIEFVSVKEYKEVDEYSDEKVTIWDGYEYHTGYIVTETKMVPTGNIVSKVTKGVEVTLPEIRFDVAKIEHNKKALSHPVKQKFKLSDDIPPEYKKRLFEKYNLTLIDEKTGYIENKLIYNSGLISLYYRF